MGLRINYNYEAATSQRALGATQNNYSKSVERLSSGLRINRAADDTAGLAISEKLKNQVRGLDQASRNAQDGISLIQTAEGALGQTHDILSRMRELAVQSANDTLQGSDRDHIQDEVNQLISEVDRIAKSTQFNKINLLDGSHSNAATTALGLHIGANREATSGTTVGANELKFTIKDMKASALGDTSGSLGLAQSAINGGSATYCDGTTVGNTLVVNTRTAANESIENLDVAIEQVSKQRGALGAYQNRLEHTITSLGVTSENTAAANSRIRDVDVAAAMSEMVRNQVLQQSAMSILAQANQAPQQVLQLLR
jgi:flagellin